MSWRQTLHWTGIYWKKIALLLELHEKHEQEHAGEKFMETRVQYKRDRGRPQEDRNNVTAIVSKGKTEARDRKNWQLLSTHEVV